MPIRVPELLEVDAAPLKDAPALISSYQRDNVRVVTRGQLDGYGSQLVVLGRQLQAAQHDLVVFPLRGGLKPGLQLEVLTEYRLPVEWLPFTGGSNGTLDAQVLAVLQRRIAPIVAGKGAPISICAVDTSISGDSALRLAGLFRTTLEQLHAVGAGVVFYLLHEHSRYPWRSLEINALSTRAVSFMVHCVGVDSLLVEDWSEAFGVRVVPDAGGIVVLKPAATEGSVILRDDEAVRIVSSPELNHLVDVLIAKAVAEDIQTDPRARHIGDVWERYSLR